MQTSFYDLTESNSIDKERSKSKYCFANSDIRKKLLISTWMDK